MFGTAGFGAFCAAIIVPVAAFLHAFGSKPGAK